MMKQSVSRFDSQRLIENREIRIFLSSTFADMDEERSALVKTFELLKVEANRRNVTLSAIDLRWGVTDSEVRSGRVLSVCLEEIERSHPFFIGLLGNHYGTSPDISVLKKNPELEERYPWIRKDIEAGLSITEIEIRYGVLRNPNDVDAVFFFKDTPGILPDNDKKLTYLKTQIREDERFKKDNYMSVEELCTKVETTIRAILDKHFPEEAYSQLDRVRTAQKAYMNSRHGHYQKQQKDFDRLDTFLKNNETHLVITGPSGIGKSALVANWLKEKENEKEHLPYNIIYHFVGNTFNGSDYHDVLQHICDEIYDLYGLTRQTESNENLEDEVQRILIEAGQTGKPLLIVIDGINQIDDSDYSKLLNWLPQAPQHMKYLFSTLDGDETMNTFKRRSYPVYRIGTLNKQKRKAFIINYLDNVGKHLEEEQMNRILDDHENENMLVLKSLLDELICFGSHIQLNNRIDFYLNAPSINEFFDRVLQRMENDFKESDVPCVLSIIALSEDGLSEEEIMKITNLRPLDFHLFFCSFYNHFVTRNGLLTFSHQHVTDAIWKRYGLDNPENANPYRQQIIDTFSGNINLPNERKISELSFQFYHTNNDEGLYNTIMSFEAFSFFDATDKGDALLALYWRKLLQENSNKYSLHDYLDLPIRCIAITDSPYFEIGKFILDFFGDTKSAMTFYQTFLSMVIRTNKDCHSHDIGLSYNSIGAVYANQGDYDNALTYYFKALNIEKAILGDAHPNIATSYNNIGAVYYYMSDFGKAIEYSLNALSLREKLLGRNHTQTATSYNNIGSIYDSNCNYEKALEFYFKALNIKIELLGELHPDIATIYANIGGVYNILRDFDKALEYHTKALNIKKQVLGLMHPDTALSYNNIGLVYSDHEKYDKALEYYFEALAIQEQILDSHPDIATSYNNIGCAYDFKEDYDKALEYYYKALAIQERVLGNEHTDTAGTYNNIGAVYYHKHEYDMAMTYYLKALAIDSAILGDTHLNTSSTYLNIGMVYDDLYDYEKALEYYLKAHSIREQILGPEHPYTLMAQEIIEDVKDAMEQNS